MPNKNCNCKKDCKCNNDDSCCNAIEKAIGKYFFNSSNLLMSTDINNLFSNPTELITRTQLFESFLVAHNAKMREAFRDLAKCKKCKDNCCTGAAKALAEAGIGYVNLAYQAVLAIGNPLVSPGSPVLSLQDVLNLVNAGSDENIDLILDIAGCRHCD